MPFQTPSQKRTPGLVSIEQARRDRQRGRFSRATPKVYAYVVAALVASVGLYYVLSTRALRERKNKLFATQRAIETELGPRWFPMQESIEKATRDFARGWPGDHVEPGVNATELRTAPAVYLRLRVAEAAEASSLRAAATASAKDGFVGCFMRGTKTSEASGGIFLEQPWNLRQAYAATRVLSEPWLREVEAADEDLRLRIFEQQLDTAVKTEIPVAIDVVTKAKHFLLVLDEDVPEAHALTDAGVTSEVLQLVAHPARVVVVDLKSGRTLVRVRKVGSATFLPAGEHAVTDPEVRTALQRQVNNCALAQSVLSDVGAP